MSDIPIVSQPTIDALTDRQQTDFHSYKSNFIEWLQTMGKDPQHVDGYAHETIRQTSFRVDRLYRWKWDTNGGYTTSITPDEATQYIRSRVSDPEDYSNNYLSNEQKAIKRLFKWLRHTHGLDEEWDSPFTFGSSSTNVRDYLTVDERRRIREAAIEYNSIPAYTSLSPSERNSWKQHLSQRLGKPKSEISPDDFDAANSWKIPSLVWTSLDTGLRPVEVKRATVQWIDVDNKVLRIPKSDSSKNSDNWIVSITDRTATALDQWLTERLEYKKYDGTTALWLTQKSNPYNSLTLSRLMKRLCDHADISTNGRQMSWYTIRHSVGTFMTRERDLKAAQAQLRHKSPETTMKYDQAPVKDRRDALNKMG